MSEPPLFERLKRARAVQIGLVYLGASWFVLQLVDTLQQMLSLPAWIGPVTIVLLLIGLFVVMATAMVQAHPATTEAEEAGELPTDWEIAPGDVIESVKSGRIPHLTWGRAILGGVVAISLTIGVAGAYVLVTQRGAPIGPAPLGAEDTHEGVAVMPFTVSGPGLDDFAEGMVSLVSMNIDGVDGIRSVNPRTVMSEWEGAGGTGAASLDDVLTVAGATGARYAVVGDAVSTGTSVRFSAELYDLADGQVLGEGQAEGAVDEVLGLIDEMSVDLLRTLVGRAGSQSATGIQRLEGLVTSSIEALGAYLEGEEHYREGRSTDALEAYERAVASDSTFALAWSRIASVWGWIQPGAPELGEARGRAMGLLDRLPAREATLIRGYADVTAGEPTPGVLEDLRQHVRRFPDDPEGWAVLGEYYLHLVGVVHTEEQVEQAVLTAVDLDPGFAPYYIHALRYLVAIGDWRFFEYMEMYRGVVDEERAQRYQMQWDFFYGGDEARAAAERYYGENQQSAFLLLVEVFLRSDSTLERSLDLAGLIGPDHPARAMVDVPILVNLGRYAELGGDDPRRAVMGDVAVALAALASDATVGGMTPAAAASRLAASEDPVSGLLGQSLSDGARSELASIAEAARLLADGAAGSARDVLEAMPIGGGVGGAIAAWPVLYAESLARTGQTRRAILQYEADLQLLRAVGRLRLGELYESIGEPDRARENFEGFLRLHQNADEGGAELVERGRAGLTRVSG